MYEYGLFCDHVFIREHYRSIHIYIENLSDKYLKFSLSNITLKTTPSYIVAQEVYRNTKWYYCFMSKAHPRRIYNQQSLLCDLGQEALRDCVIAPGLNIQGIIFVAVEDYKDHFIIVLNDEVSDLKVFCKVDLQKDELNIIYDTSIK